MTRSQRCLAPVHGSRLRAISLLRCHLVGDPLNQHGPAGAVMLVDRVHLKRHRVALRCVELRAEVAAEHDPFPVERVVHRHDERKIVPQITASRPIDPPANNCQHSCCVRSSIVGCEPADRSSRSCVITDVRVLQSRPTDRSRSSPRLASLALLPHSVRPRRRSRRRPGPPSPVTDAPCDGGCIVASAGQVSVDQAPTRDKRRLDPHERVCVGRPRTAAGMSP